MVEIHIAKEEIECHNYTARTAQITMHMYTTCDL